MISHALEAKIEALAQSLGLYVYNVELLNAEPHPILRISITRKAPLQVLDSKDSNSISLQDCQNLSELLSPMLDVEGDSLPRYSLEVSSPGLERTLKKLRHYELSLGEEVSLRLMDKSVIEGVLMGVESDGVVLGGELGESQKVGFDEIKKAKTIFNF